MKHKFSSIKYENSCSFHTGHPKEIIANPTYCAYHDSLQAGDATQALASAAMPILPLLKTAAFDPEATKTLASAFNTARSVLLRSDSTLAAGENAVVAREVLAMRIVAMGRTGERDRRRLVNDALVHMESSKSIFARWLADCGRMVMASIEQAQD